MKTAISLLALGIVFGASAYASDVPLVPVMACIFDTSDAFPSTRVNPVSLAQEKLVHAIRALFLAPKGADSISIRHSDVQLAASYRDGLDAGSVGHSPFSGLPHSYDRPASDTFQGQEASTGDFIFLETPASANQWKIVVQKDLQAAKLSSIYILSKIGAPLFGLCAPCTEQHEDYCDEGWAFP